MAVLFLCLLKKKIIKYCNVLDRSVKITNSCNTIIRKKDKIKGYNTDYLGIKKLIFSKTISKKNEFYIFGSGGFCKIFL